MRRRARRSARPLGGTQVQLSINRLLTIAALATICAYAPQPTQAQSPIDPPTTTEIRALEAKVRMPHGATSLRKYVRYYYSVAQSGSRTIAGIYIARSWLQPSEIPTGSISVVAGESEVSVPEDAGCAVVFVAYEIGVATRVRASCGAELVEAVNMPPNKSLERTREG